MTLFYTCHRILWATHYPQTISPLALASYDREQHVKKFGRRPKVPPKLITHIHTKIRATSARKFQLSVSPLEPTITTMGYSPLFPVSQSWIKTVNQRFSGAPTLSAGEWDDKAYSHRTYGYFRETWTRTENIKKLKIIHEDVIFMHTQQRSPEPHLKTNTIHKDVYITISGVLLNAPKPSAHWEVFMMLTYRAVRLIYPTTVSAAGTHNPGVVHTGALLSIFPENSGQSSS